MDLERKAKYWTDISDYDLETARAMLTTGRWLYAVFMCQQAMEKALKAVFLLLARGNEPPRTHNLMFLLEQLGRDDLPDEVVSLANRLSAYYIESRYPSYKVMLSSLVDQAEARDLVDRTVEAMTWIRSLPS
jgi:HEPN domain-containing protein